MHMQAILNTAAFAWDVLVFRNLKAFLEPDCTVPWRQTRTVRLEKIYSEAAASLSVILSLAEKAAITTNAWKALITESCVTVTYLPTGLCRVWSCSMPERRTVGNIFVSKYLFQNENICFNVKFNVFYILNKFRCRDEARMINILL